MKYFSLCPLRAGVKERLGTQEVCWGKSCEGQMERNQRKLGECSDQIVHLTPGKKREQERDLIR